ncbi:MAG: hypothetical protein ABFD25_20465 [Clostridiaceae bacterium]
MKRWMVIMALFFCFVLPSSVIGSENPLAEVEAKILSGDLDGAYKLFKSGRFIIKNPQLHYKISREVENIIKYFNELSKFNEYIKSDNENMAIATYKKLQFIHDKIPHNIYFTEKMFQTIDTSFKESTEKTKTIIARREAEEQQQKLIKQKERENEEKEFAEQQEKKDAEEAAALDALKKKCGKDFGRIEVGMNFNRINECYNAYAKFYRHGQLKTKNGVVTEYRDGSIYVYVTNGKVAAWGKY